MEPNQNTQNTAEKSSFVSKIIKSRAFIIFLFVCLLGTSGLAYYFYYKKLGLEANLQKISQQVNVQQEDEKLIAAVGKLTVLPEGEKPTIATVTDPEKLKDQPFFINAKKGNKVLIYANAKKAILYDPIANMIIDVAPINLGVTPVPSVGQ
jgi:hypothetical protein